MTPSFTQNTSFTSTFHFCPNGGGGGAAASESVFQDGHKRPPSTQTLLFFSRHHFLKVSFQRSLRPKRNETPDLQRNPPQLPKRYLKTPPGRVKYQSEGCPASGSSTTLSRPPPHHKNVQCGFKEQEKPFKMVSSSSWTLSTVEEKSEKRGEKGFKTVILMHHSWEKPSSTAWGGGGALMMIRLPSHQPK